jgi:hypothetical protein
VKVFNAIQNLKPHRLKVTRMEAKTSSPGTLIGTIRIVVGDYIAEVVADENVQPNVFHWFVKRLVGFEVVVVGEEDSREGALKQAEDHLSRLRESDGAGRLAELHLSAGE